MTASGFQTVPKELEVLRALRSREYGNNKSCYRSNLKILRKLVCQSNFMYRKVWEKQSNKAISCEGGRIYFNNFQECYSGYTRTLGPKLSYRLPASFPYDKIEDALVCQITQESGLSWKPQIHRNSLFGITRDNVLVRFDIQTGEILQSTRLPDRFCFRNLSWETEGHSLTVKSIHLEAHRNVVLVLAVYDVCPLNFMAMVEVAKSVFGRQVRDASLSQGLLITMHASGLVKFYSFTDILREHKVEPSEDMISGIDSDVNICLKEEPPVLFELKCADHLIEIGGSPWHYLYSPPHQEGIFHVAHLETRTQAQNGLLEFESYSIEPHRAIFHPDDSGRIIHIGDGTMRVYHIGCSLNGSPLVEECFTITATRSQPTSLLSFPEVTKSGRRVKKRVQHGYTESDTMHIEDVDYETELDFLCVTSVQHGETLKRPQVYTGFYHNWTGQLIKETVLEQPWESFYEHRVVVDLDTIVQIIKPSLGLFRCVVYRLVREEPDMGPVERDISHRGNTGQPS